MKHMRKVLLLAMASFCLLAWMPNAIAKDVYYYILMEDLKLSDDSVLNATKPSKKKGGVIWSSWRNWEDFRQPYAVGTNNEEIYFSAPDEGLRGRERWLRGRPIATNAKLTHVAIRAPHGKPVSGKLYVPTADWKSMVHVDFKAIKPNIDQSQARENFYKAKMSHYRRLFDQAGPGSAWFRHQVSAASAERIGATSELDDVQLRRNLDRRRDELQRTYSLLSGGRALSENLQLNRELRAAAPTVDTVETSSIEGLSIAEIDWKPLIAGKQPKKDFLASSIPHDQHAIFFPSFQAMTDLTDESAKQGTPLLRMLENRSEDAGTKERYERQLCVSLDYMSRILGPRLIASVAFTGSDPYLRTGSDVAILYQAKNTPALIAALVSRQAKSKKATEGCRIVNGEIAGIAYQGVVSPGRTVCSYLASGGKMVVVTNSLYQLEKVLRANQGKDPSMATLDEYTFFRDRYVLGATEETALIILTDAAIRRWCGPRWRIGASRRTLVAAAMAELQARHMDELASGKVKSCTLEDDAPVFRAGEFTLSPSGVASSVYGTLGFQTPIAELPLDMVSMEEATAYRRFKQNYQRQWRQFFDPIAVRITQRPDRLAMDMTVRPLIAASRYRQFIAIAGDGGIGPNAGDQHPEALLQFLLSLDPNSQSSMRYANLAAMMMPNSNPSNVLNWIGDWVAVYADDDPMLERMKKAMEEDEENNIGQFFEEEGMRLPIALHVDVKSSLKLTIFLTVVRAFIEQTSPGMTEWVALKHNGQPYVRIMESGASTKIDDATGSAKGRKDIAVFYAATPKALVITLNEELLKRSLDRMVAGKQTIENNQKTAKPWLGKHLCMQANEKVFSLFELLGSNSIRTTMESSAWENIVILNEWHRRYGQHDPSEFQTRFWQTKLVCPGGGKYTWNEEYQTMQSTVFGHPGQPRNAAQLPGLYSGFTGFNLGLTFEGDGLRAQGEVTRKPQ
jgi:hypothetical protein